MNLLVKKFKEAIVVLLLLSFFVSCEDPSKIGLDVDPKNSVILTRYKEFVLPSTQVQFNPRSTSNSSSLQAGTYSDQDFGTLLSKSYLWLGVQPSTPVLNSNAAYVNTVLSIQFSSFYGSEAENLEIESFEIYQLAGNLSATADYTRIDEISLGALIGTIDILIQERDTVQADSVFTVDIDDSFGQILFDKLKANDAIFDNDTSFNEFIKGIAIIAKTGNNKIIQFNSATFNMKLNYTEENSAGQTVERNYSFGLGAKRFYHLSSNLSATSLSGILPDNKDFMPSGDYRYMQAGTLIALKADYGSIISFFEGEKNSDSINSIIIQKAWLSVGDVPANKPGTSLPPDFIAYFTDDANTWPALAKVGNDSTSTITTLQNEFITQTIPVFPGYYDAPQDVSLGLVDTLAYEATMSNFIQNLILGGYDTDKTPLEPQGKLLLYAPTSVTAPQSAPSHTQTNFFKVHKDSIRVKIYYSTSNL